MKFDIENFLIVKKIGDLRQRYVVLCLSIATLLMTTQLFVKINRHAVNILFSDQWDTYQPTFNGDGAWRVFAAQAGQLRLGIGGLMSDFIARATGWNTRAESFAIGFSMVLIVVAALYLKYRLFKKFTLWDLLIPFICLSVTKTDVPIVVPFPSHSTVPILLLLLYAICLTFERPAIRFGVLSAVNFLTLFTGWGLFVGLITPVLLAYFFRRDRRGEKIWIGAALAISVLSFAFYFYDYTVYSGVECFSLPHYPLSDYWKFFSLMLSNSVGFDCGRKILLSRFLGTAVFVTFVATAIFKLRRITQREEDADRNANLIIVVLLAFSGLFIAASTLGRVCLGECSAVAGRYQPLLIPAWLAVYFAFAMLRESWIRLAAGFLLLIFCFVIPQSRSSTYSVGSQFMHDVKVNWKACYLATENAEECDKKVGTSIFSPVPSSKAQDRLDYLKANRLNLYSGE